MKTIYREPQRILFTAIVFAALGMGANSASASSYYLQIGDIKGESTQRDHRDWIDVDTFYWGITKSSPVGGTGGTRPRGTAVGSPLSWTQGLDSSVPKLFVGVASGRNYQTATLEVSESTTLEGSAVYFKMFFENVVLTSLNLSGTGDSIGAAGSLVYEKLTMTYRPRDGGGRLGTPIVGVWDLSDGAAATFSGSPEVLEGLFLAGPTAVPAPAAVWLLGTGVLGLAGIKRWRRPASRSQAN
jgi:type VI protein secretion system component Hcp